MFAGLEIYRLLIPFFVLLFAFLILIIWPQIQSLQHAKLIGLQVKPGVVISTTTGTIGTVLMVLENSVVVEMYDGSRVQVLKQTIKDVVKKN